MSYDLTIKFDDEWSRFAQEKPLADFIASLPNVQANGELGFVLSDGPRHMEIDLEVVSGEGDNIQAPGKEHDDVNCVALHIPYANLGDMPERDYFPTALAIARHLGWRVFDEQRGEYLHSGEYG